MAISRAQTIVTNSATSGASASATWGAATTAGNLLVAILMVSNAADSITPPSGWTLAKSDGGTTSGTPSVHIYYIANAATRSGSEAFTITSDSWIVELREYSGAATTSAFQAGSGQHKDTATAGPIDPTAITTLTDANGVSVVAWVNAESSGVTQGAPSNSYTSVHSTNLGTGTILGQTGEKIGGLSLTSEDSTVSLSTSKRWSAAIAAFASGGGGPPPATGDVLASAAFVGGV